MAHFFKRQDVTVPVPDQEELEMLRQKTKTLEELVKIKDDELQEEKQKYATLQQKTADWKEKVKQFTTRDRERIAELEEELKVLKTIRETGNVGMTAELQSLVEQAIATVRSEHKQQQEKQQGELNKARATIEESNSKLRDTQHSLETLQEQYIALQQRFSHEMESMTKHHELEMQKLREYQNNEEKISALENQIRKQQEEIETLENHTIQQKNLADELQKELAQLKATNEGLEAKLHDSSQQLVSLQEEKKQWAEHTKNTKLSDDNTTQQLRETPEKRQHSESPDRSGIPSLEKLQKWKDKVKQDKIKDLENIRSLTQQLQQSKQQTQVANDVINEIATELQNTPPNVSHCINIAQNYCISAETFHPSERALSTQSTVASTVTIKSEQQEESNSSSAELRTEMENARQQRDELQRELDSAREEVRLLQEQCNSNSAEQQTELENARQQRDELQRELDSAREEVRLLQEQCNSNSAEQQTKLDSVVQQREELKLELETSLRQREEVQQELDTARKELLLQRERASSSLAEHQAELQSALDQREKVQKELESALQEREKVRCELDSALEELRVLREQSNTSSAEQQAELENAWQQRGEVQRELNATNEDLEKVKHQLEELQGERQLLEERCSELEKKNQATLEEKESELRLVDEKLLVWKEKVKVAKAKDDQRIESLEALVTAHQGDVGGLAAALHPLLAALGHPPPVPTPLPDGRLDVAPLLESLNGAQAAVAEKNARVATLEAQLHDAEKKCAAAAAPEVLTELEQRNAQLEEKCELLRKEIKRQREAFQREKGQQDISTAGMREEGRATLRAAAGGVFEKDMLSLANQQSQRDNEIRQLRAKLQTLEKENAELKRDCDHNNSVLAQYTKDIEVLKAKERVQLSIEYVRNVVLQFLCCPDETVRLQMVPAIATVLEFTPKEKMEVQNANPACPRFH